MTELNIQTYIINGLSYTKDEILADDQLKKKYLENFKYNFNKEKTKQRMRELRADEIYKEQNRIKINKRYAEDLDYRTKKLEKSKERRHAQALLNNKPIGAKRGRQPLFKLNDNLECVRIC